MITEDSRQHHTEEYGSSHTHLRCHVNTVWLGGFVFFSLMVTIVLAQTDL